MDLSFSKRTLRGSGGGSGTGAAACTSFALRTLRFCSARRERGAQVLVHQKASALAGVMPLLHKLPYEVRPYGAGKPGREGNVRMQPFSETGFVDDLGTARAAWLLARIAAGEGKPDRHEAAAMEVVRRRRRLTPVRT